MIEIYYIGGSPCSGKSTVADMLSRKYDLYFSLQKKIMGSICTSVLTRSPLAKQCGIFCQSARRRRES